ncbi:MAG: LysR family transcriptional regulator [Acidobacteria bacterium]|nr:LysR family transcriptional regulator [Acidobacteriota bacterium]
MVSFRLQVFRAVAKHLSFRKAAEELYLSQPAISLQIKALEEELGLQVFDRGGTRVSLTAAGNALLRYVARFDELAAEAEIELAAFRGDVRGKLALGASLTIAQYVLPRFLGAFLKQNPLLEVRVATHNTERVIEDVVAEQCALGLIEGPPRRRDVTVEPLLEDELVVIAPPSHEWAAQGEIEPTQLRSVPLLLREQGSGSRLVAELALRKAGLRPRDLHVILELDMTEAIKSGVEAGLGIGIVSRWTVRKELELGTLAVIPVRGLRMRRHFSAVYRAGPDPQGPAAAFLRFLRDAGGLLPGAAPKRTRAL